ncbi:SNF2 family N-terminal domain-containing protein, partial [Blyttiomyces helicus]
MAFTTLISYLEGETAREPRFYIKWKGRGYRHNTWEPAHVLRNYKGYRRVENFKRQYDTTMQLLQSSPDDLDQHNINLEIRREILAEHTIVERVIASREGIDGTEYFCKWRGLEYEGCTWETADEIAEYETEIDRFLDREQSRLLPHRSSNYARARPAYERFEQPDYLSGGELREYQLLGVNWLAHLWHQNLNGILADEMGLGKTVQTISFISYLFHHMKIYGPFLIVVPLSTIGSWAREFAKWAPDINLIVYQGREPSRRMIQENEFYTDGKVKFNALLTTFELVLRDKDVLGKIKWSYLAVDEAHRLKNADSQLHEALKDFHTANRLLITGTPLQNSVKELVALVRFLMPAKFEHFEAFEINVGDDGQEEKIAALQAELKGLMLRRLKKDVEKSLPGKQERILRVELSPMQLTYYKAVYAKNYDALNKSGKTGKVSLQNIAMELKKASNHPYLFDGAEGDVSHKSKAEQMRGIILNSGKMVLLDKLLKRLKAAGNRVLIFSQMVRMLDILSDYFAYLNWPAQRLDGSTGSEARKRAMDHFNAPDSTDFVFLLSTRAGGLGINLETADTVILFDLDWNPQNDLQAIARAHRIGQKKIVNVYRFIAKDTIEENIIDRAKQKMVLEWCIIKRMDTTGNMIYEDAEKKANEANKPRAEELQTMLKFGAQKLFAHQQDGEDQSHVNKLEELNLDEILARAEHHEVQEDQGTADGGHEFLKQWDAVDVQMNELKWDELIPEAERKKAEAEATAYKSDDAVEGLGRRRAAAIPTYATGDGKDSEGEEDDGRKRKRKPATGTSAPRKARKKLADGVLADDKKVTQALVRSLQKFGSIHDRYDQVVADADVGMLPREAVIALADAIVATCEDAVADHEKAPDRETKATSKAKMIPCTYGGVVNINAGLTVQRLHDLAVLGRELSKSRNHLKFRLDSGSIKPVVKWSCDWTHRDDSMLLVGIYRHGFGNWDAIQADHELGLRSKLFLGGAAAGDKAAAPSALHLMRRAEYLLKTLRERDAASRAVSPPRSRSRSSTGSASRSSPLSSASAISSSDESFASMDEGSCKERLRPVKNALKALREAGELDDDTEKLTVIKDKIVIIGDHIIEI